MADIVLSKRIEATPAAVFAIITDFARAAEHIPAIRAVEVLTPGPVGVGTRFRETRVVFGKEATETFEVVEYDPPATLTLLMASGGTEYRCEHRVTQDGTGARLGLVVRTRARTWAATLFSPLGWLLAGVMKSAMAKDLDAIAAAAEGARPGGG